MMISKWKKFFGYDILHKKFGALWVRPTGGYRVWLGLTDVACVFEHLVQNIYKLHCAVVQWKRNNIVYLLGPSFRIYQCLSTK